VIITKFKQEINKLKQFFLLLENENELLVLTSVSFNVQKENNNNPFQPYSRITKREIPTIFLITTTGNSKLCAKILDAKSHVLNLEKMKVKDTITKKEIIFMLNDFIDRFNN